MSGGCTDDPSVRSSSIIDKEVTTGPSTSHRFNTIFRHPRTTIIRTLLTSSKPRRVSRMTTKVKEENNKFSTPKSTRSSITFLTAVIETGIIFRYKS